MEPNNSTAPVSQRLEGPVSLLRSAWSLFSAHWKIIVPIVIAPSLLIYIGQLLLATKNVPAAVVAGVFMIVGLVVSIAMSPAAINAIHRLSTESGVVLTFKEQYRFGFGMFWSVVLIAIIQTLASIGSFAIFVIPGVIVCVYSGMYLFARVIDGKRGFSAFNESFSLVKGRWWEVFGRIIFLVLFYIVCVAILTFISFILSFILGMALAYFVTNLITSSILGSLALIYVYRLYLALRASRSADVSAGGFKKWLIVFMVIGVLVMIVMPFILFISSF
jgi:hypothetical protein